MKSFQILIFLLLLGYIITGCTSKIDEVGPPPPDLIPRDTMVNIIADIHLMDAIMQNAQKRGDDQLENKKIILYESIMEKHQITRDQFESSLEYYEQNLDVIDAIYADVITRLSKMKSGAEQE
ncbi:MAG: DUF4296 domain-containing protein [Bacteroidales bacterium]|nr:DUF4296 domain-containing protein [Bacteroidales bacterium]